MKGYEKLDDVLARAFKQASQGKGKERHANELPFHEQPMQQVNRMVGVGFSHGQAIKKIVESQNMPPEQAVHELLGAICYIAGGIITLEAANDNQPQPVPEIKNAVREYLDENFKLVEVEVGTMMIPDNWVPVPEGAVLLVKWDNDGISFHQEDGSYFECGHWDNPTSWDIEDILSGAAGCNVLWKRETTRDQAEKRAYHEALEQFKHQAETISPFTWESKNFGMVTVNILGGLCRVTRCGHHVINSTNLKEVFEHLEG